MSANITTLDALAPHLSRGQRLAGLDLGTKTIGVALSDVEFRIGTAKETIKRLKFRDDAARLAKLVRDFQIAAFVIGLPLNMDGSEGPRAQATRAFVRNLAGIVPLPVVLWDERLSTAAAERAMIAADMSRARRGAVIDAAAAAYILQGALDRLARLG